LRKIKTTPIKKAQILITSEILLRSKKPLKNPIMTLIKKKLGNGPKKSQV
jgi:hypothetical protein